MRDGINHSPEGLTYDIFIDSADFICVLKDEVHCFSGKSHLLWHGAPYRPQKLLKDSDSLSLSETENLLDEIGKLGLTMN